MATAEERVVLDRWTSWGALQEVFDERVTSGWAAQTREQLRELLTPEEYGAARRTVLNAHYTDPAYVDAVWAAMVQMGAAAGRGLEPGCGSGLFLSSAPGSVQEMVGIELDPVTAAVAAARNPDAAVRAAGFESVNYAPSSFDFAVGNVPFAPVRPYDPTHNPTKQSLHNYFILKSLDLVAPGGTVAVMTSRYTLDAEGEQARRLMYDRADLLGAVRLPTGSMSAYSGTDVVIDVLVLRRRAEGAAPSDDSWVRTAQIPTADGQTWTGSAYWLDHPENILGTVSVSPGQFTERDLTVTYEGPSERKVPDVAAALAERLGAIAARHPAPARARVAAGPLRERTVARTGDPTRFEGFTRWDEAAGRFLQVAGGVEEPFDPPKSQHAELRALLAMRDLTTDQLALEAAGPEDTEQVLTNRAALAAAYQRYARTYGALNRFRSTDRETVDRRTGEPKIITTRHLPPAVRTFKNCDPFAEVTCAIEVFDEATMTATPAPIQVRRVVKPRTPVTHVETLHEALAVTLDQHGRVDVDHVASLLGTDVESAAAQLGQVCFVDPATQEWVTSEEYLSGDVMGKLDVARAAAEEDSRWRANVTALEQVQPVALEPGEIHASLGAVWIPAEDVQQFAREMFRDRYARVVHAGGSAWNVEADRYGVAVRATWGTEEVPAGEILGKVLRQENIVVMDRPSRDEPPVINQPATEAAQARAAALRERFSEWVWEDPERATRLAATYNRTFNNWRLREYDTSHLTFPGLVEGFVPREHQRVAVARMITQQSVGLYHEVGAGKTAEMIMGCHELKRLGMVNKPMVVVPNHMREQFTREWLQLYPTARILAASSEDVSAQRRASFVGRCATNDWDAVIITQSAFSALGVDEHTERRYQQAEVEAMRRQVTAFHDQGVEHGTVKKIEKAVASREERLKKAMDRKVDAGLTFESTGVDYLCVDELHLFKNLTISSSITGIGRPDGAKRATDLDMKLGWLREKYGSRVFTGATATPITNSVAEAYVMQRYTDPDLLRVKGFIDFDSWAATFGTTTTGVEPTPQGGGYRTVTRFAKFQNVPELLKMWWATADIKTAADLNLPRPQLVERADGRRLPEVIAVPANEQMAAFQARLQERAQHVSSGMVAPTEDNMLKISTHGRMAALDLRLVEPDAYEDLLLPPETKIVAVAEQILEVWRRTRGNQYTIVGSDELSSHRGALQMVFCDMGTPGGSSGMDVYAALRAELRAGGMEASRVQFIHDANSDTKKARLFAACRNGEVDVLIGSTGKMGVGTNVQHRLVAMHHMDCPWRPADVTQREGRILRQGNQNPEVEIYRAITQGSFDAYMWTTVERKARFIEQVMTGKLSVREMDDVGEAIMSFAEMSAASADDPRILQRFELRSKVEGLERAKRVHDRTQNHLRYTVSKQTLAVAEGEKNIDLLRRALERRVPTAGEAFAAEINTRAHGGSRHQDERWVPMSERGSACHAIAEVLLHEGKHVFSSGEPRHVLDLALLGGMVWDAELMRGVGGKLEATLRPRDCPKTSARIDTEKMGGVRIVTKMEDALAGIEDRLADEEGRLERAREEIGRAREALGTPFDRAPELAHVSAELRDLEAELRGERPDSERPLGAVSEVAVAEPPEAEGRHTFRHTVSGPVSAVDASAYEAVRNAMPGMGWRGDLARVEPTAAAEDPHHHHLREQEGPRERGL